MRRVFLAAAALAAAALGLLPLALPASADSGSAVAQFNFAPTATIYTAGQCLGPAGSDARISVSGAVIPNGTGGTLAQAIFAVDPSGQDAPIDFLFFNSQPSNSYTDHATCALNSADYSKLIGVANLSGYKTYGTPGVGQATSLAIPLNVSNGTITTGPLWVVPVVQGTPTYGAITLYFTFGVLPDGLGAP